MCGWQPSLPTFLLAIPKGAINTPDGAYVDYLTVSCSDFNHPEWNSAKWRNFTIEPFNLKYPLYFQFCTVDSKETVWTSGTGIDGGGNSLIYDENSNIGRNTLTPEDRVFIQRLRNLVINILLTLEFLPALVSDIEKKDLVTTKGFGESLNKFKALDRLPRWLGKNFSTELVFFEETEETEKNEQQQTEIEQNEINRTHSSPIAHWRKGHWRVLKSGEGKKWKNAQRIWIKPIYVNF
jgi:hypothetical protein